ncbi:MAG: alcohol dehydrogenase catalytic domain-containing protein, partial [Anaerolineales bacterium]|nr:alcohol dehydrogenase catalytic domain-containing protein [Anaerolineales bacterium]
MEVDTPVPRNNEVLIKIYATTVTSGDVVLRRLKLPVRLVFRLFFNVGRNKILGHELAGVIEETGGEVTLFKPGDLVFASTGNRG